MKERILAICLSLLPMFSFGQLNPIFNVASPEVASLGTYGQIPVSLYTGTPNINIPIYDLKVGSYTFPVSFSYHLASVKPNVQAGCLGLGWSLMAGGYITRTVRGIYDEKMSSDGIAHGYYAYATRMKNITNEQFKIENDSICPPNFYYPNRDHDISADEFSFSFFGYSGNFYYNEDKGWTVVSDKDIVVEFDESDGFINLDQVKKRIKIYQWAGVNYHNRFFRKFTLITPDGCKYVFGGINAMEFSIPYYGRNNGEFIATTWRLSKIITPQNHVINITYDTTPIACNLQYSPQTKVLENIPCQNVYTEEIGRAGFTGFLLFPTNIQSIETPNDTLDFVYFKDPGYGDMFPPNALYWDSYIPRRENFFFDYMMSSTYEFGQFLGENIKSAKDVAAKFKNNILHCIKVRNGASNRTYYFDYQLNNRRKLSKFTVREGLPSIEPKYAIPNIDSTLAIPEYSFKYYDQSVMPRDYVLCRTDSWGYYTNGRISISEQPKYSLTLPQIGGSLTEVLKEISYPTKGRTQFEYENHTYSKQVSSNRKNIENKVGFSGGLRIKEITKLKQDGTITKRLRYHYAEDINAKEDMNDEKNSSGISNGEPQFAETYYFLGTSNSKRATIYSTAGFSNPVTNQNSPSVGYSSVIEETLDADGNQLGYTRYRFSNYDKDIYGVLHLDESPLYMVNCQGEAYSFPYTSNSEERGKLLSKENYDRRGFLTSKTEYRYERVKETSMLVANQRCLILCYRPQENLNWSNMGWLTKNHLYSYLPTQERNVKYLQNDSIVTTKSMEYDTYKQLTAIDEGISDKGYVCRSTEITYPYNDSAYDWMTQRHLLSPVVAKTVVENEYSKTELSKYNSKNGIPYVAMVNTIFDGGSTKQQYIVTQTDAYGNPQEIEKDGMSIVLLWGNHGQDLVAKIENAHYDEYTLYQLGISNGYPIDPEYLAANRHKLPSAHIYIYKHDKARRLTSISYPNGTTDYYSYDFLDRLREIYDYEESNGQYIKRIKHKYDYGYKI